MSTEEQKAQWRAYATRRYAMNPAKALEAQRKRGVPCRGCGALKAVPAKNREAVIAAGGPLCHDCRRKERERIERLEAELRERRLAVREPRKRAFNPGGTGRRGTGSARYRRNRIIVLSASDICGICGHPGAATVDHIISAKNWTGSKFDLDDIPNLQPAHGSLGSSGLMNRCAICGRLCNQSKGAGRAS